MVVVVVIVVDKNETIRWRDLEGCHLLISMVVCCFVGADWRSTLETEPVEGQNNTSYAHESEM